MTLFICTSYAQGKRAMHEMAQLLVECLLIGNDIRVWFAGLLGGEQFFADVQLGHRNRIGGKDVVVVGVKEHRLVVATATVSRRSIAESRRGARGFVLRFVAIGWRMVGFRERT